jgi:hypothetical protein
MESVNDDKTEVIIDIKNIDEEEWTDEDYRYYKCMERTALCFIVGLFTGVIVFVFIKTALL